MKAPRRSVKLQIDLEADSWKEAAMALYNLSIRMDEAEREEEDVVYLVSGGYSSGYTVSGNRIKSITHDLWADNLEEYLSNQVI